MQDDLTIFKDLFDDMDLHELFFQFGEDHIRSLSGMVIGYKLDNAFGEHVDANAVVGGWQEFVIRLETFNSDRKDESKKKTFLEARFNLCNLINIVRTNADAILESVRNSGKYAAMVNAIVGITMGCREDLHEPDEQAVGVEITTAGREVSYRYTNESKDVEFVLFREIDHGPLVIKGPNAARMEVRFTVQDLIMLITKI